MILTADYHTHTIFSHGKGTIKDNVDYGRNLGLKEIGISDHGFAHPIFGLSKSKIKEMRNLCDVENEKGDIKVKLGIESNIIGIDGSVDLKPKYYDNFDVFLCGMHKFIIYKFFSYFSLSIPNLTHNYIFKNNVPNWLKNTNTKTYINVIKNNPVDAITHLNFCCSSNAVEVAKACADYGTYIELNAKKTHLTIDDLEGILKTKARFIISSDAHSKERVGEISLVKKMLDKMDFPLDRIDNIDGRLPNFRFKKYKENAGR